MESKKFNVNVGIRIRNQREKLGYSREKLAELAEMSDGYLGEVERGTKGISSFFLHNISVALGITMDYLTSQEEDTIGNSDNSIEKEIKSIIALLHFAKEIDLILIEKIVRAILIEK